MHPTGIDMPLFRFLVFQFRLTNNRLSELKYSYYRQNSVEQHKLQAQAGNPAQDVHRDLLHPVDGYDFPP